MFKVKKEKCDQCLFTKNRLVSKGRMKNILDDCKRTDSHFVCHKSDDVCCRGFFDTQSCNLIRIAGRLGMVEFVEVN